MAIGLLSGGSQQLNSTQSLTATGTTSDVFTFPNPPTGLIWTGTLSVAPVNIAQSTPASALFTATIGGTQWGEWGGNSVYGPVQANSNQQLVVSCSGLTAGVAYVCTWVGSSDPEQVVQPLYPAANSTALTAQIQQTPPTQLATKTWSFNNGPWTLASVAIPPNVRTLLVNFQNDALVGNLKATGDQTGFVYYNSVPYLNNVRGVTTKCFSVIPIGVPADTSITFVGNAGGPGGSGFMTVFGDVSQYDESVFYNGNIQAAVSGGPGQVIAGPCRLLTAWVANGTGIQMLLDGTTAILQTTSAAAATMEFPPNTILPSGHNITINAASGGVTYAYP